MESMIHYFKLVTEGIIRTKVVTAELVTGLVMVEYKQRSVPDLVNEVSNRYLSSNVW